MVCAGTPEKKEKKKEKHEEGREEKRYRKGGIGKKEQRSKHALRAQAESLED